MSRRTRIVAAFAAALLSAGVCIATILEPHWFEVLFDSAPDGGDGSLETMLAVAIAAAACMAFLWIGAREWCKVPVTTMRGGHGETSEAGGFSTLE